MKSLFGSSSNQQKTFRPQLTSLIDVMTILLVFLIKNMAVEGQLITPSADLELPMSSSDVAPKPAFMVEITKNSVVVSGQQLQKISSIYHADSMLIFPLYQWIMAEHSAKKNSTAESEVLIQCDKEMQFDIVKRVMYTCNRAGFSDFSLLAIKDE